MHPLLVGGNPFTTTSIYTLILFLEKKWGIHYSEKKYNLINQNLKEIQSKLSDLKESKARNEATIEGMDSRKNDLLYSVKNELSIENERSLFSESDLSLLS